LAIQGAANRKEIDEEKKKIRSIAKYFEVLSSRDKIADYPCKIRIDAGKKLGEGGEGAAPGKTRLRALFVMPAPRRGTRPRKPVQER